MHAEHNKANARYGFAARDLRRCVQETMESDIIGDMAKHAGAFFIRERNSWTRVSEADGWRIFREPVEIWFEGGVITDTTSDHIAELLRRVPDVTRIRFLGTVISEPDSFKLKMSCPKAQIEGTPHTTNGSLVASQARHQDP